MKAILETWQYSKRPLSDASSPAEFMVIAISRTIIIVLFGAGSIGISWLVL